MHINITGRQALLISSLLIILMAWLFMKYKPHKINVPDDYEQESNYGTQTKTKADV